jgi:hypothetical protein
MWWKGYGSAVIQRRGCSDPVAVDAYLAHMVLRQVDWSLRHHPGSPATRHHLQLARLVAADLR